jgi:hypothetical protein
MLGDSVFSSSTRVIFYTCEENVRYSGSELSFLDNFKKEASIMGLPRWWREGDTLRFAQRSKYDMKIALQVYPP